MTDLFAKMLAQRPTRASYSAISTHETCGAWYKYDYILATGKREAGPAAARGTRLHLSGELFLKGDLDVKALPVDYWRVKSMLIEYKRRKAKSEEVWCVDRNWKFVPKDHPSTFLKSIVDIHWVEPKEVHVRDLKTGRIYREEHEDQLQLYGTKALIKYPKAQKAIVAGTYIDQGVLDCEAVYPRTMLPMLVARWTDRANKVLTDTEFKPNPSPDNCVYCPHSIKKGGPCAFGV